MTGVKSSTQHNETVWAGLAAVPDERFDKLVEIYKPVKVSPAKVPFVDVHAMGSTHWEAIRQNLKRHRRNSACSRRLFLPDTFFESGCLPQVER